MELIKKCYRFFRDLFIKTMSTVSPVLATRFLYRSCFEKKLNLKSPQTFNEKIQWLKLNVYNNNELITRCVDKYAVREYVTEKGYASLLPQLYKVCQSEQEITKELWESLPDSFVMKCTHGCGANILCYSKKDSNIEVCKEFLGKCLSTDYWKKFAEIQYKGLKRNKRKIIIEQNLGSDIKTIKFYCFYGEPKLCYMSSNGDTIEEKDKYVDFFDLTWKRLEIKFYGHTNYPGELLKPTRLGDMLDVCRKLSEDFPFVRVDLYYDFIHDEIYFSELTFVPTGGFMKIEPVEMLDKMGSWLSLESLY